MKKVLFVDDEIEVLDGLRNSMRKYRSYWDCSFVVEAASALDLLQTQKFDIIISDMRMPSMDGAELLLRVQKLYPSMARIILSGYADKDAMLRAHSVAHVVISKPYDSKSLHEILLKIGNSQLLIPSARLTDVIGKLDSLPSPPIIFSKLLEETAKPNPNLKTIAQLICQDPSMSTNLMKVINSSYFNPSRSVFNLEQATYHLGLNMIKALLINIESHRLINLADKVSGFDLNDFQKDSLRISLAAKKLAPSNELKDEACMAGLLHDIGIIILVLFYPKEFEELLKLEQESTQPYYLLEQSMLGFTHAEIGAYLLGLWGLPQVVVNAVAFHHTPSTSGSETFDIAGSVHIAEALLNSTLDSKLCKVNLDTEYVNKMGLTDKMTLWSKPLFFEEFNR